MQVAKKSAQERMPSLSKYSDISVSDTASHDVEWSRNLVRGEGENQEIVAPEAMGKAYMVGRSSHAIIALRISATSTDTVGGFGQPILIFLPLKALTEVVPIDLGCHMCALLF
jgi:hypothetical protein